MINDPRESVWAALTYRVGDVEKRMSRLEGIVSLSTPENPRAATISKDLGGLCNKYQVAYDHLTGRTKGENLDTIRHNIITDLANMGWTPAAVAEALKRHTRNIQKRWPLKLRGVKK
jgi:hypothetical protein